MAPKSVMVTGANRGIGLGLVKELLKNKEISYVIATARKPDEATELKDISDTRLSLIQLNVDCDDSIRRAYDQVEKIVGDDGLTVLLNNAGIYVKYYTEQEPKREEIIRQLNTNSVSVAIITQVFLPLLKKAAAKSSSDDLSYSRAAIINISSGVGSIGTNTSGSGPMGMLAYRMSKSALNSLAKTLSIDLLPSHILVASFCPGWVQTDMGGPKAMLTIDQSAEVLVKTFETLIKEHTGGYFKRDGEVLAF